MKFRLVPPGKRLANATCAPTAGNTAYAANALTASSAQTRISRRVAAVCNRLAIIGTQLLTRFARHIPQQNLVVYGLGGMGIAVLTTAAFGTMGSTAAGMIGMGLCASAIFITATTLIQHETPHELLGRVMSCLTSLVAGSQVISMFVAGPVAEKMGIPDLYYGSAAMLIGIGVVGYFKLLKAEKIEAEKAESAQMG